MSWLTQLRVWFWWAWEERPHEDKIASVDPITPSFEVQSRRPMESVSCVSCRACLRCHLMMCWFSHKWVVGNIFGLKIVCVCVCLPYVGKHTTWHADPVCPGQCLSVSEHSETRRCWMSNASLRIVLAGYLHVRRVKKSGIQTLLGILPVHCSPLLSQVVFQ